MDPQVYKIMVAGEGGVGKTTLLHKYVSGTFTEGTGMTIGIEFHLKNVEINGQPFALQLWDLGGQPRFRFMLSTYCLGAHGAILLYDVTRMTSLDALAEWINDVLRKNNPDLPILFCGTKIDLDEHRSVSAEYAEQFLQEHNLFKYLEVSAKSGENVELAFEEVVKKIAGL